MDAFLKSKSKPESLKPQNHQTSLIVEEPLNLINIFCTCHVGQQICKKCRKAGVMCNSKCHQGDPQYWKNCLNC